MIKTILLRSLFISCLTCKNTTDFLKSMKYIPHLPLYTDLYEITMASGYWQTGKTDEHAVFNYFFRDYPFDGGYVVFAGIKDFLYALNHYEFDHESMEYLKKQGFRDDFIAYLQKLSLTVEIESVPEGSIVFPGEPLITLSGPLLQCQLLETMLLNQVNFQSLIATKASRIKQAAGEKNVMDFGLRRAQGIGGLQATRAAYIGGIDATSNVWSAMEYQIPASGTVAHSWVQSFQTELEAFRTYAERNPDTTTLLIDTYDTLNSGIPNAITVAKELEEKGHRLVAVRLDSGDPVKLSRKVRTILDKAGLEYVKIALSDQLDEYVIDDLLNNGAPIDLFGVGTRLVTGNETPALDGVYKISEISGQPVAKRTDNPRKQSLPGHKSIIRLYDDENSMIGDVICLKQEVRQLAEARLDISELHPDIPSFAGYTELLEPITYKGELADITQPHESREHARIELQKLDDSFKRLKNPERYPVWVSQGLSNLQEKITPKI